MTFVPTTPSPDLVETLRSGRILLMDGAMGTELQRAGCVHGECCEAWNLSRPDKVRAIHQSYADAGADVLLTNSFQANSLALARHGQDQNLGIIFEQALLNARAAAGHAWVLADIGPLSTTELGVVWPILNACGAADGLFLETFSAPAQAAIFARANASRLGPHKPLLVSFTFDGTTQRTFDGTSPEQCAHAADMMGAAALGVNCGRNLDIVKCAQILRRYRAQTGLPLFARPNAGSPNDVRAPYAPQEMAKLLPHLLDAGAVMIGGCCGTTPEHIRAFRTALT